MSVTHFDLEQRAVERLFDLSCNDAANGDELRRINDLVYARLMATYDVVVSPEAGAVTSRSVSRAVTLSA